MDAGGPGPVLGPADEPFLAALLEEVAEPSNLGLGLEAHGHESVSAAQSFSRQRWRRPASRAMFELR